MKVAVITRFMGRGGVGSYVPRFLAALKKAGHEISVFHDDPAAASRRFEWPCSYVQGFNGKYRKLNEKNPQAEQVLEMLKKGAPDLVHVQDCNNFYLEARVRENFPAVKTLHVYDFCPTGNKFHFALNKCCSHPTGPACLARMVYKRCTLSKRPQVMLAEYSRAAEANKNNRGYRRLITASEYVRAQALATGYPAEQVSVVPYFVEPVPASAQPAEEPPVFAFAGRLEREKGMDLLLRAAAQVSEDFRLLVAGDGGERKRLEKMARSLGLGEKVVFSGWLDEEALREVYRRIRFLVIPSAWPEPFGICGIESLSHEKPVLAFRTGGIPEWLEDGVSGFLVPPGDTKIMAEKISELLAEPQKAAAMGARGKALVEKDYGPERHVRLLAGIYAQVTGKGAAAHV